MPYTCTARFSRLTCIEEEDENPDVGRNESQAFFRLSTKVLQAASGKEMTVQPISAGSNRSSSASNGQIQSQASNSKSSHAAAPELLSSPLRSRRIHQKSNPTTTTPYHGAPSAPGVHDTLRSNLSLTTPLSSSSPNATNQNPQAAPTSIHPLEARLTKWRQTQDALKMEGLRRTYGMGEPIRRGMELKIAGQGEWKPVVLGGSAGVHRDVLAGRDCEVQWEDVFRGEFCFDFS